jgi:transposase InsO family protein
VTLGARQKEACKETGISVRTIQRWRRDGGKDNRKGSNKKPGNKLSDAERQGVEKILNSVEYRDLSPAQIVPRLADKGIYLASESTFYRILKEMKMNRHREASKPKTQLRPQEHVATGPNQVWSWDITYLPLQVRGLFLYLYMVVDIYSRKIVAWHVHDHESADLGADLVTEGFFREGIKPGQIVLHSDNGSPMKGATMLAKLQELGVVPSFSRPSVSDDNPYSESLFRTLKYRPQYPESRFSDMEQSRNWVKGFVDWYNNEHLHSGIRFVTASNRHDGKDRQILSLRNRVYEQARRRHPQRWSGKTRNWTPVEEVYLNKVNKAKAATERLLEAA